MLNSSKNIENDNKAKGKVMIMKWKFCIEEMPMEEGDYLVSDGVVVIYGEYSSVLGMAANWWYDVDKMEEVLFWRKLPNAPKMMEKSLGDIDELGDYLY